MKLTIEQQACVVLYSSKQTFKVEAVAGSGKTTTIRVMAESDLGRSTLYLAFNKVAANEASAKMPSNTDCRTTHSMAYRSVIKNTKTKLGTKLSRPPYNPKKYINAGGTVKEIKTLFKVVDLEGASSLVIARVAKKTVATFESSSSSTILKEHIPRIEVNVLSEKAYDTGEDFSEIEFCNSVLLCSKSLWKARINENSPVVMTHDTYLKMYQLSKPILTYDVIFLDEAQDTSDCVLDIVMQQIKRGIQVVAVGDSYQAIYGWRGAVNALAKIKAISTPLTQSWRYGPSVAKVATYILDGRVKVVGAPHLNTVVGEVDTSKPYTKLFRTNIKLIQKGVELIRQGVSVRIDVDLLGFVKLLKSLVALKAGNKKEVKHEDVLIHATWKDLLEEAKVIKGELKLLAGLVEDGNPGEVIRVLSSHTNASEPHVILTTAHKSKGMEYNQVILADDFMSVYDAKGNFVEPPDMERNLLYVSTTRAKEVLEINKTVSDIIDYRKNIEYSFGKAVRTSVRSLERDYSLSS